MKHFERKELDLSAILPLKRQQILLNAIQKSGIIGYKELAVLIDVSLSTLRRDLKELEQKKLVKLDRGGALSLQQGNDLKLQFVPNYALDLAKQAIGKAAAELVKEGETIILDVGTTVMELARAIDPEIQITCVTNDILIAVELCKKPNVDLILTGGSISHNDKALSGPMTEHNLRGIHAQKVFLGAAGISEKMGISNYNLNLVRIRQAMIEVSEEAIVLADHSKFGRNALASVARLDNVQRIVTSSGISEEYRQVLSKYKIETTIVESV
jgi:DeoR family fructose operon transcriptional repressor